MDSSDIAQQELVSLKRNLKTRYGDETASLINSYEKCVEKLARYKNHVAFNLRCKSSGIIPPSLHVTSPVETARARRLAQKTSERFLKERIRHSARKKKSLDEERKWTALGLKRRVDPDDFEKIVRMVNNRGESTFVRTKRRQEEKFARFQQKTQPTRTPAQEKWIVNLSKHQLNSTETEVLGRGLNFAPAPTQIPTKEIIASVEPALRKHKDTVAANVARAAVCNILRKAKPPPKNLTRDEKRALTSLRENNNIVIAKADKGNVTVVLDKEDYEDKANEILLAAPFQKIDKDGTKQTERKLNHTLKTLLDKKVIDKELYNNLRVSPGCSKPACFYGLPKIHKTGVPLRPIVSHVGHPLYNTAKHLGRLLSPFSKTMPSFVENSAHLAEILRTTSIDDDEILVSFDVKSLYTSVPVKQALDSVEKLLSSDQSWANQSPMPVSSIVQLLKLCLEDTSFKFRNQFYRMTDGLAMGSPVSPIVANIFMAELEQRAIETLKEKPKLWLRFVDDILSIVKRASVSLILEHLNQQNPAIVFTIEQEQNRKLPFLDGEIYRIGKQLEMTVFRKPTHSGRYLNFNSHHTISSKCSVADALFARAESIISDENKKQEEFRTIRRELLQNGYPAALIKRRLSRVQEKKNSAKGQVEKDPTRCTIVMPFVDGTTQALQRVLKPLEIRVVGKSLSWKWSLQHHLKDSESRENEPGVIYRIKCNDCLETYIGETGRTAKIRVKEHAAHAKNGRFDMSAAADHALNKAHHLDWEKVEIIDQEKRLMNRRVKEALWIHAEKNNMNRDKGLEIDPMWFSLI